MLFLVVSMNDKEMESSIVGGDVIADGLCSYLNVQLYL